MQTEDWSTEGQQDGYSHTNQDLMRASDHLVPNPLKIEKKKSSLRVNGEGIGDQYQLLFQTECNGK